MNSPCLISPWENLVKEQESYLNSPETNTTESQCVPDTSGMKGEVRPEKLSSEPYLIILLLLCFIPFCYALKKTKTSLLQQMSDFIQNKERSHYYDTSLKPDIKYFLLLIGIGCILCGIWFFYYFSIADTSLFHQGPHKILLSIYIGLMLFLYCYKYTMYRFINWIFFDKEQNKTWAKGYIILHAGMSVILFPYIIIIIFSDLSINVTLLAAIALYICSKILLFYKSIKNFFYNLYGVIHLILYFCALEIVPDLLLWKVMEYINNIFNFNFLLH